ncbi:MAG: hypothetical protein JRG91_19650, partial [Deltaproteobacteria bacterium]|nr:hypothetical protein [Deltaproteobacteria bacterium]
MPLLATLALLPGCYRSYQISGGRDGTVEITAEPDVLDVDTLEPLPDEEEPVCTGSAISMIEVVP